MARYNVKQSDGSVVTIDSDDDDQSKSKDVKMGLGIFALIWMLLGIAAFVTSIVCWAKRPEKLGANIGMFFVALFLGPLYWIIMPFAVSGGGYCRSSATQSSRRSSRK